MQWLVDWLKEKAEPWEWNDDAGFFSLMKGQTERAWWMQRKVRPTQLR